jgi:gliding motility-associated-like protein
MKFIYSLTLLALCISLFSQRSKDGIGTINAPNTIVNAYTSLTNDANAGTSTINVANSASFSVGDLIMIIQMQGTKVNAYWEDGSFNDPNNSTAIPNPTNLTYGSILDYYTCGNNEFAEITSIPNGTSITLDCSLKNSYTYSVNINIPGSWGNHTAYGNVQVIKVPRYSSLTINSGGSITCPQWNGTTGGVVAVEVEGNTILSNSPSINADGKGFRGGITDNSTLFGGNKWGAINRDQGGYKGESIAGDTNIYKNYAALISRGAIANGGGGGCAHNAGGGGGANGGNIINYNGLGNPVAGYNNIWNLEFAGMATNISSGGGRGGYSFSNSNQNVTTVAPGTFSTGSNPWNGDKRRAVGGFGGRPLDYSTGKIFMGGGGGAGDGQDNRAGAGGNGGGIVFLVCYGNLSGNGTISANGANGSNSGAGCAQNDGAGGGGGGGAIVLNVNGTINLTAGTALSAVGGNGGNVNFNCSNISLNCDGYGPGGGGGGGYIASSGTLPSNTIIGGLNGIQSGNGFINANSISNAFPPNGATRGGSGGSGSVNAYTLTPSASQTLCTNQAFTVTATSTEPGVSINWYNTLVGGSAIATGTAYASSGYTTAGTYTLFAGACSGTYRQPIELTVTAGLNMTVNSPTICPNQTVTLTASGATTYTWNTGPTTSTINVSPSSTTIYTINGTSGLCSGTRTTVVTVSSQPTISVASTSICSGNSTTLTANGATNYTWNPGGQTTTSIVVSPTITTSYSITGSNGACTNSTTALVNVTTTPTLAANSTTICPSQIATFTATGATNYTWSPGNISGATFTISPASTTTVAVIGANGTCTSQITRTVSVSPSPTIAVSNQTICPTQTATLTANGASTYTWNTGPTTSTISVSPSSQTIYTVTGTLGNCTSSQTATVSIAVQPTIAVASASICSGNSATLTANGATSYTWATGGQTTSSVVVTPSVSTTYTITGSNGICSSTTTANVNVTSTPTLAVSSVTICPTQTATLNVSGATSYTWNPGSVAGITYTIAPASNTIVTVIGASGNCTASASASVTIGTGISITVNNATICAGQTASLVASGASSYTWSSGANTNTLNVNPTITTVYTISGTSGACSGINTVTVDVISQPTVSVSSTSICSGSTATLTASGASNYTWTPSAQTTASITDSPNSTTIYTITGTNGVCTNTTTATINVTATPTVAVSSATICTAQTATLTANGATNYTWTPGNSLSNTFTLSPSSNTVVSVIGANGTCTSQTTASITIGSSISITVNSATICAGETASLTANGTTSYTWDSGATTNTINVTPSITTIYTVTGSNGSCNGINTSTVTVNSIPTLTVNSANICSGQTATLSVTGANTYTWSNGVNGNSISISPTTTTVFTVTGTSTNGCVNSSITTTTVNVTATPTISINTVSICAGQTATLTATGATNYTWSTSANTASIVDNPNTTTNYSVSGDNGGCSASATTTILVTPSPTITASSALSGGCAPFCTNFTDNVSTSATGIVYNFGDGNTASSNNPNHCFTTGGSYTVTATVTNSVLGCSSTFTLPAIDVITKAVADFNISQGNIVTVGTDVNFINTSTNATNYIWSLICTGQTATSTDLNTLFADTGSCCINLVASQPSGCSDTVTKCIDVINKAVVVIPNVFTPNGDGKNDVFKINSNGLKSLNCVIYDRWGLKMYEWDGINGSWDGNAKTGIAPDGTYFYIINYTDLKDTATTEKGYLNLFN